MCARLAAIEKALYYPTPTNVVEDLVRCHIRLMPWSSAPTYILDPCAGEGQAVHTFAEALRRAQAVNTSAYYLDMLRSCQRQIRVKAVEIDAERAAAAGELLGAENVLHSAIENVSAVGKFSMMWLNPPYDQLPGGRAELAWVRMCAPFVGDNGMMVLIVPDMFVGGGRYAKEMEYALGEAGFGSALVLRFPDPEYQPFKQVAIIVSRPSASYGRYSSYPHVDLRVAGVIGQCDHTRAHIITASSVPVGKEYDTRPSIARATLVEAKPSAFAAGQFAPAAVLDFLGDPAGNADAMRPLAPMRSEHAAMVAAAGMFNGAVVGGKVMKGSTIKRVVKTTNQSTTDSGTEVTEVIEAEVLAAQLATIDMRTGDIQVVNSQDHKDEFEKLLEEHAGEFVGLAKRIYPPVFAEADLARYESALARVHAPRALAGRENGLFPPQTFRAGAILDCWRRHKVATLVGEMGCGKTIVAVAAATNKALQRKTPNQKVVVLLPPKEDLVKKWAEEIRTALRDFHPHVVHAETISDVQTAFERDGLVFILIKETTAKMSSGWTPVQPIRRRQLKKRDTVRPALCPACGKPILYSVDDPTKLKARCKRCGSPMWTVARRTNGNGNGKAASAGYQAFEQRIVDAKADYPGTIQTTRKISYTRWVLRDDLTLDDDVTPDDWNTLSKAKDWYEETVTNEVTESALRWPSALQSSGNNGYARYPLARFIRDRYRDRYVLIIDEVHAYKASDAARSYAAQDLLVSSHCAIQMTGTIYNGLASSIYYLLWRALPEFRAAWGWGDVQRFINQYGLFETITRTYRDPHSTSASGYTNFSERKSERPGIHPAMIALLLPSTVFFGIRDLDMILPLYAEHTLFVERPAEFRAVEAYLDAVKSDAVSRMWDGDYTLMAQFNWAKLGAWDVASQGDEVDGHTLEPLVCPGDTQYRHGMWPKEEALLRLIAREKRAGRKVLCFVGQINRRDPTGRLCSLLERYGMKGAVMRASEKARVEFIRRALRDDADVVFTSAQLVKEGIDLLELPTLVWYAAEYNIYLVQQANRRSWRIGQTQPVHIYYLAYDRTPQAWAMHRIAKKLAAAQTLQGDVRQGLAALLGEEDFVSRLQEATISVEHFESDLSLDDLPPLVPFEVAAVPQVDVQVTVQTSRPAQVRVIVQVEDLNAFQQLSLF